MPRFVHRAAQVEMAHVFESAIADKMTAIVEAGTGCGKSAAYLTPAIQSGKKTIISTGTKNLQDQLFNRDIPAIKKALNSEIKVALLKGRANYVCLSRLEKTLADGQLSSRAELAELKKIQLFARNSKTGDKAHLLGVSENAYAWHHVTASADHCTGKKCPHYDKCFVVAAREEAINADMVVVNHHLFFADVLMKGNDLPALLPHFDSVVFDEAHQMPDAARSFYSTSMGNHDIEKLVRDIRNEAQSEFTPELVATLKQLENNAHTLRGLLPTEIGSCLNFEATYQHGDFLEQLSDLIPLLSALLIQLNRLTPSDPMNQLIGHAQEKHDTLNRWLSNTDDENVCWLETHKHGVRIHITPVSVAKYLGELTHESGKSWIFCSATLTVRGSFDYFQQETGILAPTHIWDSPFDYQNQSILYAPNNMPEPNTPGYNRSVVEAALPLIHASNGGAFLLFTSLRAMREAQEILSALEKEGEFPFPIYMQGEFSKQELLDKFIHSGNAVLLGCQSFWEGVDVPGHDLRLVVIDKLPFGNPNDPVLQAKAKLCEQAGKNAFMEIQVPEAALTLKQGAGRLIRTEQDTGVLMIADPRMLARRYGRYIWQSLPPMKRTRDAGVAMGFLASCANPLSQQVAVRQ
jgi:ATP-dependent DNA helicase DinG